jgi:hypothetical protein
MEENVNTQKITMALYRIMISRDVEKLAGSVGEKLI